MSKHIWTTNAGDKIPVSDMTDSHLLNAHRLIVNRHDDIPAGIGRLMVVIWVEDFENEIASRLLEPLIDREWHQWYDELHF